MHTYLFSSDAFSLLFLLNQSPFRHLILSKFALLRASRQEEAAPGRAGAGVLSRKRGPQEIAFISAGDGGGGCGDQAFFCRQN